MGIPINRPPYPAHPLRDLRRGQPRGRRFLEDCSVPGVFRRRPPAG